MELRDFLLPRLQMTDKYTKNRLYDIKKDINDIDVGHDYDAVVTISRKPYYNRDR